MQRPNKIVEFSTKLGVEFDADERYNKDRNCERGLYYAEHQTDFWFEKLCDCSWNGSGWKAFISDEKRTWLLLVESYRRAYGYYPKRVLADTIFRTRENMKYCKQHGIHLNGPKLGKPYIDPALQRQQKRLEWQESGERGEIERNFGVGKRRYCLDCIVTKPMETSKVMIYVCALHTNLRKKLRLLLRLFSDGLQIRFRTAWKNRFLLLPEKWHLCRWYYRRVAMLFEKLARRFPAMVHLASCLVWLA